MSKDFSFVYFGGEPIGPPILEQLLQHGFRPKLVVASPDRPLGRKQTLTPPAVKVVAKSNNIAVFQPESFKDKDDLSPLLSVSAAVYVVVAYNHILPEWLISAPKHGAINVHPSLLPKYRGANPIRTALLNDDKNTGVSIMLLDEKMDHGPILAQKQLGIEISEWPLPGKELDNRLATLGGQLLIDTLPQYVAGEITLTAQEHNLATYTKKMIRTDGELNINPLHLPSGDIAKEMYLKICAYDGWPETYFLHEGKRVKIKEAKLAADGSFRLLRVTPEGKSEMEFTKYLNSL